MASCYAAGERSSVDPSDAIQKCRLCTAYKYFSCYSTANLLNSDKTIDTKYDITYNISRRYEKCQNGIN